MFNAVQFIFQINCIAFYMKEYINYILVGERRIRFLWRSCALRSGFNCSRFWQAQIFSFPRRGSWMFARLRIYAGSAC